ncbi:hypothetical protein Hanom_Chr11g00975121 [Helianthus anomalus]
MTNFIISKVITKKHELQLCFTWRKRNHGWAMTNIRIQEHAIHVQPSRSAGNLGPQQ